MRQDVGKLKGGKTSELASGHGRPPSHSFAEGLGVCILSEPIHSLPSILPFAALLTAVVSKFLPPQRFMAFYTTSPV